MAKIDSLVSDIYAFLTSEKKDVRREDRDALRVELDAFGRRIADKLWDQFTNVYKFALRASNLGTPCRRKLWYSANKPTSAEPINGPTRFKFLYGDIIEELTLLLARLSGHTVTDEQGEITVAGVRGHIDAVVDGRLVDVKSASTNSYRKFKEGLTPEGDGFGYLGQLGTYAYGKGVDVGTFIAVDKTLGNITLDTHVFQDKDYEQEVTEVREMLQSPDPPSRHYEDKEHDKSGNRSLGFECSYCAWKRHCWPGLRRFAYAKQPIDFTVTLRHPTRPDGTEIPEIT